MEFFLLFLQEQGIVDDDYCTQMKERFCNILHRLARRQAESIDQDKPTHIFVRKLFSLLESGQVYVRSRYETSTLLSNSCIGFEDGDWFYLYSDATHRAVRKLCEEQGETFSISSRTLLKALAEEGLIDTASGQNTKSIRLGGKSRRVVCLNKEKAQRIADGG